MQIVSHRINTVQQLQSVPSRYGVEVDIRSYGDTLIIHHDPFIKGEDFEDWLKYFNHSLLILNVKEEGLEEYLLKLMRKFKIENFFFLDQSFPFLMKTSKYEHRCAVRVSEYESFDTALSLSKRVDWVWFDTFKPLTLIKSDISLLKQSGFKICLVSPELQGRDPNKECFEICEYIKNNNIEIDAVCTKHPELWK